MKYIALLLVLGLTACKDPDKQCAFAPVVRVAASALATKYDCNESRVQEVFMKGLDKVGLCKSGLAVSGINAGGLGCMLVPAVVKIGESYGQAYFQCKKDFNLESAAKDLLKCD